MEGPPGDVELSVATRPDEAGLPKEKAEENKPVPEKDEELKAAEAGESKREAAAPMTVGSLMRSLQQVRNACA